MTTDSATLRGEVTDLGDYDSVQAYFRWQEDGAADWEETAPQTIDTVGEFDETISGLNSDTLHNFTAVIEYDDPVEEDTGDELQFTTEKVAPSVDTLEAEDVTTDSATLRGNVTSLGDYDSVEAYFRWQEDGAADWEETELQTIETVGEFDETISGLNSDTLHNFTAVIEYDTDPEQENTGDELQFTTEKVAPSVDTLEAEDVTTDSATLRGNVTFLGDYESVDAYFRWQEDGEAGWTETTPQTIDTVGEFDEGITDLTSDTLHNFTAVIEYNTDQEVEGDVQNFTTFSDDEIVVTLEAQDVTTSSATLRGEVTDLEDFDEVEAFFDWRENGEENWDRVIVGNLTDPGEFDYELTELGSDTEYEFRAGVKYNEDEDTGDIMPFTTDLLDPVIDTLEAEEVTTDSAILKGEVTSLGDYEKVDPYFEWQVVGEDDWTRVDLETLEETGEFDHDLTGLNSDTEYEFRAGVEYNEGEEVGDIVTFTTLQEATFELDNLVVDPDEVYINEEFTVEVDVNNVGDVEGTYTAEFYKEENGLIGTDEVTVEAGETETASITHSIDEPGTYQIHIDDLNVQVVVSDYPEVMTDEATDIGVNSARLHGELTGIGLEDEVTAYFRYREEGSADWIETTEQTITEETIFYEVIEELESNTTHEFKAVIEWDGEEDVGEVKTFTTIQNAFFEVEIVDYDEAVKIEGELLVDYTVTNIGEVTDTQYIYFEVYNYFGEKQYTDLEEVELNEGEVHDEEFTWDTEDPGEYYFKVWTEDDEEERVFLVFEEPYFQVTIDEPEDGEEVLEGETITVEYTVENLGAVSDTQDIDFWINTNLAHTEEVELDGGSTHSNDFEWTAEEPYGERDFTIVSDDDSDTVTITVLKEAYFEVEISEPEEGEEYIEGQKVRVGYTVENTGDITDIQNIELYVEGNLVETRGDLGLEGGDSYDGEFTWTATEPYEDRVLTVESEDDQDDVTIVVEEAPEEPYFDVYIEAPSDGDEYVEGETVTVEYSIKNLGEETGTQDIEFYDGYNIIERREVELDGGSTYSDDFEWTAEEPYGTRELKVESEDHFDAVTITVLKEAYFEVEISEPIEGEEYIEGQRVRVKYKVENTGDITDI